MEFLHIRMVHVAAWVLLILSGFMPAPAPAQDSSLLDDYAGGRPLTLAEYSWTYEKPRDNRPIEVHSLVTVLVSEQSSFLSEGETDRKKKANVAAALKDWVLLKGLALVPDPQMLGDPKVTASLDNKMKSEGSLETRDSIKFRIACHVVEVRPNGNLILEGRRTIENNNEVWTQAMTGEIRPEDILPNNTVLSENVADMKIIKWEAGSVRDSYRRGWFLRWLDTYQPW